VTPTVSSPRRRGATLALGGFVMVAGTMLATPVTAFAEPAADAIAAIDEKGTSFAAQFPWFGAPAGEAMDVKGGAMRQYEGGTVYYSKETGAHAMHGEILKRYQTLGGPESDLGFPKNDESDTGDGMGRFNEFSAPEGAAMYWNPQAGVTVIKGKVLEAWNQSGGIKGPFGYPTADMSVVDGVQTGKFAGPEGTEIQWSKAAGLVTIPAALAATIPGFSTGGTTSVSKAVTAAKDAVEEKGGFKWWWLLPILALLGLLAFLPKLFRKKPVVEPVKVAPRAPEVKKVVTPPPPPRPAPVAKPVTPPAPPRPKPVTPPPPAPKPVVKTPPPAPKPVTPPPAPRLVEKVREEVREVKQEIKAEVREVKAEIHEAKVEHEVTPVIRYETHTPAETTIQVTYENNAVDGVVSRADKSDSVPDRLQE
jgi:hypothetical protein